MRRRRQRDLDRQRTSRNSFKGVWRTFNGPAGFQCARHVVAELVETYSRTDNENERTELKSQLAKALGDQFTSQQKRRTLEIDRIEAELKKVRDLLRKRSENRQAIIDKRLEQVVREAEGLGWSEPSGFPQADPVFPRDVPRTLRGARRAGGPDPQAPPPGGGGLQDYD